MEQKKREQSAGTLQDKPVPPVKGAVVDREDIRLWSGLGKNTPVQPKETRPLDGWV